MYLIFTEFFFPSIYKKHMALLQTLYCVYFVQSPVFVDLKHYALLIFKRHHIFQTTNIVFQTYFYRIRDKNSFTRYMYVCYDLRRNIGDALW